MLSEHLGETYQFVCAYYFDVEPTKKVDLRTELVKCRRVINSVGPISLELRGNHVARNKNHVARNKQTGNDRL